LNEKFCWNCYNFEDRGDIDQVALCAKGHTPRTDCNDFIVVDEMLKEVNIRGIKLNGRFCWNCYNFENRTEMDGTLLCTRGHRPEGGCDDFVDRHRKLRDTNNSHRYERALVKAVLTENKNSIPFGGVLQDTILRVRNGKQNSSEGKREK